MGISIVSREEFFQQLSLLTNDALHSTRQHGLVVIDIDAFRFVNASSGYPAGDFLVERLQTCIISLLERGQICAYVGAGSFALLLPNTEQTDLCELAANVLETVAAHEFLWQDRVIHITLSAGATLLLDSDRSESVAFSRAELALFQAKKAGGNNLRFSAAPESTGEIAEAGWASQIHHAFLHDGFKLSQRPVVDVVTRKAVLLDLEFSMVADGVVVPAEVFRDELADLGMAVTLDRWLLRKIRDSLLQQHSDEQAPRYLFMLAAESVAASEFTRFLKSELDRYPLLRRGLVLGVPHRNLAGQFELLQRFVCEFHAEGISLLLGHFGAGVDSLVQLGALPAQFVRPLDAFFYKGSAENSQLTSILASVVKSSGKTAIGLGADTELALGELEQQGFELVQGALFPAVPC